MNRRMKVERGPATAGFVPVCSSVEDMHLHHLGGTRAAQEWSARFEKTANSPTPSSSATAYTDITDGKETGSRNRPLPLSLAAPTEFTIPAVIGDYLPLEVKLNIVLEVAFNSTQPGTRHAGGLPLHFPRIKAVQRDKNVDSVDTF
jgi:hypothetical protein